MGKFEEKEMMKKILITKVSNVWLINYIPKLTKKGGWCQG